MRSKNLLTLIIILINLFFWWHSVLVSGAPIRDINERFSKTANTLLRLKDYIRELEQKNEFLKRNVIELERLLENKEKELLKIHREYITYKEDIEARIKIKEDEIQSLQSKLSNLQDQLSKIKHRKGIPRKDQKILSLERQLNELQRKLKEVSRRNYELENQIGQLKAKLLDKERQKQDLVSQLRQLQINSKRPIDYDTKILELRADNKRLSTLVQRLKEENTSLQHRLYQNKTGKMALEERFSQINEKMGKLSEENEALKIRISELEKELEKIGKEKTKLENRLTHLKSVTKKSISHIPYISEGTVKAGNIDELKKLLDEVIRQRDELLVTQRDLADKSAELNVMYVYLKDKFAELSKDIYSLNDGTLSDKAKLRDIKKKLDVIMKVIKAGKTAE